MVPPQLRNWTRGIALRVSPLRSSYSLLNFNLWCLFCNATFQLFPDLVQSIPIQSWGLSPLLAPHMRYFAHSLVFKPFIWRYMRTLSAFSTMAAWCIMYRTSLVDTNAAALLSYSNTHIQRFFLQIARVVIYFSRKGFP